MGTRPSASLTAAYGSREGKPLLFFHGYPSSRLEASGVDELARRRGIRVISLDRPGNGLSTMQPNRTIMDWTVDIRAFAEGMKLDRFAIIGGSGGGPYALACAHALPREMVAGVGLFASAPPWAAGAHHMSRAQRAMCWMAMNTPGALSAVMRVLVATAMKIAEAKPGQRKLDELMLGCTSHRLGKAKRLRPRTKKSSVTLR
jgi:pimeloyl-ACP methyl ester carboxylesterase